MSSTANAAGDVLVIFGITGKLAKKMTFRWPRRHRSLNAWRDGAIVLDT